MSIKSTKYRIYYLSTYVKHCLLGCVVLRMAPVRRKSTPFTQITLISYYCKTSLGWLYRLYYPGEIMIHTHSINGLPVQTGDIICTTDGGGEILVGQFWRLVGKLIPGDVDHIAVYVGPRGRCVEAGAKGRVITFDIGGNIWDAERMLDERWLVDTFYGIAYPLMDKDLPEYRISEIRESVADYCLAQAAAGKPYNINFLDSETEEAFYCSQLAYKAYKKEGIDLNTGKGIPEIPGTDSIIFPQEIWSGCSNEKA